MNNQKVKLFLAGIGTLILLTLAYGFSDFFLDTDPDPVICPLTDSVDITGYKKFSNGSYLYKGIIIPPNLLGSFRHTINDLLEEVPAKRHVRGCICKLKSCVRFCCPDGERHSLGKCIAIKQNKKNSNEIHIRKSNGELEKVDLTKKFFVQYGRPGDALYQATEKSLFENGSFIPNTSMSSDTWEYLSKEQYCLNPYIEYNDTYIPLPLEAGQMVYTDGPRVSTAAYTMSVSVPFFILTIIVYMGLPELRTLHGKCLCCYLLGLSVGYTLLIGIFILPDQILKHCALFGFGAYFSLMSAFCWLSVISFDLYYNFRFPFARYNLKKRFIIYSIYAWSLAFILLCLTYAADQSSFIPDNWKPLINDQNRCWFDGADGWSAMVYLYGPILTIVCFCIVMFILTARIIHSIQKDMLQRNDSQIAKLRNERSRFGLFLRLFIVMGLTWSVEIIPYLIGSNSNDIMSTLQYVFDFVSGIQGLVIFVLFVVKRQVKEYIKKRFSSTSPSESQSQDSNKTQYSSSTVNNLTMNDIGSDKPMMEQGVEIQN